MAAGMKLFSDAGCTTELLTSGSNYTLQIGPDTGLNGTDGETIITSVYLKNTGTILLSNTVLAETLDTAGRGSFSLDGVTYNDSSLNIGAITAGQIVEIYIKVVVEASTAPQTGTELNFRISSTHLDA